MGWGGGGGVLGPHPSFWGTAKLETEQGRIHEFPTGGGGGGAIEQTITLKKLKFGPESCPPPPPINPSMQSGKRPSVHECTSL